MFKKVMILQYCNALHVWWSTPLQSETRFPLCLYDDRTDLILYDGGSLPNQGTEGGDLVHVLC